MIIVSRRTLELFIGKPFPSSFTPLQRLKYTLTMMMTNLVIQAVVIAYAVQHNLSSYVTLPVSVLITCVSAHVATTIARWNAELTEQLQRHDEDVSKL